jgi:hypothetical protein
MDEAMQKETSPPPAPADAATTAINDTTTTTAAAPAPAAPAAAGAAEDLKEKMALDQTVEFPTPSAAPPPPNRDEELEDEKNTKNEKDEKEDAMEEAGEEKKEKDGDDDENDENDENDKEEEINVEDWPVSDDFLLIKCVENGCALESLTMRNSIVNFSKEYNLEEIERRWRGILFGEKSAYEVAKRLREYVEKEPVPKVEANVGDDFRTSWKKKKGEEVPKLIASSSSPGEEEETAVNFFKDAELFILTECDPLPSKAQLDETLKRQELKRKERNIHKIATLEKDLTTVASRAMTRSGIIAKIIGQNTMFTLTKRESTVGRSTTDSAVDVDLSKEGNAAKISRVQAYLKLRWNGEFTLRNVGKRPIWINNKPIETNQRARLHSHALIEVGGMRMLFVPNPSLVRCIQPESYK